MKLTPGNPVRKNLIKCLSFSDKIEIRQFSENVKKCFNSISDLGLIHTRHLDTQYCDKKIKRYCNKKIFFIQNIVVTFQNLVK